MTDPTPGTDEKGTVGDDLRSRVRERMAAEGIPVGTDDPTLLAMGARPLPVEGSGYAVVALLGVNAAGMTDEGTIECPSLDGALEAIRMVAEQVPTFRAITLLHIEDLMPVMGGSTHMGEAHPTESQPPGTARRDGS